MNDFRKFSFVIILAMFLLSVTGCSKSSLAEIYNDNSRIIQAGDSYNFQERIGSNTQTEMNIKFKKFYGMETVWIIDARESGTITFNIDAKIKSGHFKAVLISPSKDIVNIFEESKIGSIALDLEKGTSRVKIVGNDAGGELKMDAVLNKEIGTIKAN